MYICNVIEDPPCALPYIMYIHDVQVTIVHYMTVKTALRTHTANIKTHKGPNTAHVIWIESKPTLDAEENSIMRQTLHAS